MEAMESLDVNALEIRDYAIAQGWMLIKEALKDGLFVLNSPNDDGTQLVFPKNDDDGAAFNEMGSISLRRLAEFHQLSVHRLTEEIREIHDDVIALRYFSESKTVNSISFQKALEAIEATRQLLQAAASTVVNPVTFHPKLNRSEAQEVVKRARFRHTAEGSFILKVAIPFEGGERKTDDQKPIGRQAVELISASSSQLLDSIDAGTLRELYESQISEQRPLISYQFCDALSRLFDEERELPFQLIFNWSKASIRYFTPPSVPNRITFPFFHKHKIEEVKEYLAPKKGDVKGTFIATVESLGGGIGEDGQREGIVGLSILYENAVIKTRANLKSDFYGMAVDAHKKGSAYVEIQGVLRRNKNTNVLDELASFKLLG